MYMMTKNNFAMVLALVYNKNTECTRLPYTVFYYDIQF